MRSARTPYRLIMLLALLAALAACGVRLEEDPRPPAPTFEEQQTVPLRVVEQQQHTLAFVPVTISGEGPFLFALDTGASATVVSAGVAEQLGLPATGEEREVAGVIGVDVVPVAAVEEWTLGDIPLEPADVTVIELPSPNDEAFDGLFGSDMLSTFGQVTIDYDQELLHVPAQ